jgi:heptosyltransferase-2
MGKIFQKKGGSLKIVVRLPNWLGDLVMAFPFLTLLKERYPDGEIHLLVPSPFSSLVEPFGIPHPFHSFRDSLKVSFKIRDRYEIGYTLPSSYISIVNLIEAGARFRVGFQREGRFLLHKAVPLPERGLYHHSEEYLLLLTSPPFPPFSYPSPLKPRSSRWFIAPFTTYGETKELPLKVAVEIGNFLLSLGKEVVFVGSKKEENRLPPSFPFPTLFGLPLRDLIPLLKEGEGVIGMDSGLSHLSAYLGVKTIVFFFSTNPSWTAPRGGEVHILYDPVPCSPCYEKICPLGHSACITQYTEERIIRMLTPLLSGTKEISPI